jgi:hypothetical protein
VSEIRELRKIFATKRDEVTKDWTRRHCEELHDLHCSPNIIWVTRLMR